MRLNLHQLRLFMHVAETGSFSKAADLLSISQPAVSKGVRELEQQLDLCLVERGAGHQLQSGRPGMQLTEAGHAILGHARSIFAIERAAMDEIRTRVGLQRGSLTLGASTTVGSYWLPPYIAHFCTVNPGIVPRMRMGNTQWVAQQLLDYQIDIALVEGEVEHDDIVSTPWREDEQVIVVPPPLPLGRGRTTIDQLRGQRWILREPGSGTRQSAERLCTALGFHVDPWMEMASNEAIARTVACGVGVSMLPRVVLAEMLALGAVREIRLYGAGKLARPLKLLQLRSRVPSPAAACMLSILRSTDTSRDDVNAAQKPTAVH